MRFDVELGLPSASARFRVFAASDVGAVRRVNEDSFRAAPPVFVVADGMGGHNYGDQASQQAIATFADAFEPQSVATPQHVLDTIRDANDAVIALADAAGGVSGTTLSGVALVETQPGAGYHWMIFNVGDSRVYRWDGRTLGQLTVDHSVVQELVDEGVISAHEAATHPERNVITRALGGAAVVDPDIWLVQVSAEDTFLICSDGLTRELDDREIARFLAEHADGDHEPIADRLVRAAVAAGGADNVTVVVVESSFRGVAADSADETIERYPIHPFLEDTRPRP
jgi:PPM family protein phosphatase